MRRRFVPSPTHAESPALGGFHRPGLSWRADALSTQRDAARPREAG